MSVGGPADAVEAILKHDPVIVGIGVYIWNVAPAGQLVAELKRVRPEVIVILGGPQVSYETDAQAICDQADYVVTGEADLEFARVCGELLAGRASRRRRSSPRPSRRCRRCSCRMICTTRATSPIG